MTDNQDSGLVSFCVKMNKSNLRPPMNNDIFVNVNALKFDIGKSLKPDA